MTLQNQLDQTLKYISNYRELTALSAIQICQNAGLEVDEYEAGLIVAQLHDDNLVRRMDGQNSLYIGKYSGIIFLDNGGYQEQHRIYKRGLTAKIVADFVDIFLKPLTMLSMLTGITLGLIQICITISTNCL
jgi:hypothetical protein